MDEILPCRQIVFRAYSKKSWIDPDTGKPLAMAFMRRPNETGLSVGLTYEGARAGLNKCHGAATLHVGRVRDAGWEVERRPTEFAMDHCEILNLPDPVTDPDAAQAASVRLLEMARPYDPESHE